ncbi:MAG: hypothetical protein PHR53_08670 [Bacteroidales bacterium]|nr:hypothetical protein [Bacteroidales bacterium]
MATTLKYKLVEAEDRMVNGMNPQDVFDIVAADYSTEDVDGRYACNRIAQKIRFTPSLSTRKKLNTLRFCLIVLLFIAAIAVFLNKQSRFEVFAFFTFNSFPSLIFFIFNNIYVWIYLFCAFSMFRWRLNFVWATIYFALLDFIRIAVLFPEHLQIAPMIAVLRLTIVFITLLLSIFMIIKAQNRYKVDPKDHSYHFFN